MNAPTVEQLKASSPPSQSLWDFLSQLPQTMEAQIFYGMLLAGTIGMVSNYMVKWARGEIAGSLFDYLIKTNSRGTLLSFFSFVGAAITAVSLDMFTGSSGDFVGWQNVLWFGVTTGFAIDATANKGERALWTSAQRKAEQNDEGDAPRAVLPVTIDTKNEKP